MKTRNGIFYNLEHSDYRVYVPDTKTTFIFSSKLYLTKFEEQFNINREEQKIKFRSRYKLNIETNLLFDLMLYIKIEKRGFLIINEGGQELCQENLILNGEQATRKD